MVCKLSLIEPFIMNVNLICLKSQHFYFVSVSFLKCFMMRNFWDERYSDSEYAYGEKPNVFFESELKKLPVGKILLPAEGEGRNAVFAARLGWDVKAFDLSIEGKKKAELLASKYGVSINYQINSFQNILLEENSFECIALVFAHLPKEIREKVHNKLIKSLAPGGTIILESFSKKQISNNTGGPRNIEMLYSKNELEKDFSDLSFINITEIDAELAEGKFHNGIASLIRLVGKK